MWHRKKILFLCVLLLFIFFSNAFCQSGQIVPIERVFSTDSVKARATQVPDTLHPARAGLPGIISAISIPIRDTLPGPVLSPDLKCQWVRFQFSGTKWDWMMRKPGTYAGKVLVGCVMSNGNVRIDFRNFSKLSCTDGSGTCLKTHYSISPPTFSIDQLSWMRPSELNASDLYFNPSPGDPQCWALWQRIKVGNGDPAAEFEDRAVICIELLNMNDWVEEPKSYEPLDW